MLKTLFISLCSLLLSTQLWAESPNPHVILKTDLGEIEIELDAKRAPISVKNFLQYVDSGFYDNTLFHRVIPGFMVQGGGYNEQLELKTPSAPIKNEANNGLHNVRGTVAMARTQAADSATSQFFINHRDNNFLDQGPRGPGYAVFGRVVRGMTVVDQIAQAPTERRSIQLQNIPRDPIRLISARRR
ncbi:peptidyl-prolyl cis-trans isomerase A (cyclophilin A) [Azomonas agilis]|uniref:Peptidyl-prolyl cis-trans isomerase n=1 Tax=Azomonas agilis TaxID=116849 RepID=A0A562HYV3_9GAMM|nr:peptidylprolyl isomerase [Azomonas agilis]TWH63959.1 peptidyl-prolyl cis-trans isomerase A (cyclophilin A) [Azomonas agilis]